MTKPEAQPDRVESIRPPSSPPWGDRLAWSVTIALGLAHGVLIWLGLGGGEGIMGPWPPLHADHGFHFHHGLVTREFLKTTGTTAGYDPSFMSGYPMSVISGTSSTLSNLAILAFGGDRPAVAFKVYILICVASAPWLMALAGLILRAGPAAIALAVTLFFLYLWTDFGINYAAMGMTSYFLAVPLGLVAAALLSAYFERGGRARWLGAASACALVLLVHVTSVMVVGPAGLMAYAVALIRARRGGSPLPISRHLGLLAMVPAILVPNAFWLLPGFWLRSTAGPSDFAFIHPEPMLRRIGDIFWTQAPIEPVSIVLAIVGVGSLVGRGKAVAGAAMGGMVAFGFGWGYLAGAFRSLDPLQPGRQTYACYSAACLVGGIGLAEILGGLRTARTRPGRLDRWALVAMAMVGVRVSGPALVDSVRSKLYGPILFLSSRPTPELLKVVEAIGQNLKPGDRLLFEETGFAVAGLREPFAGRHLSPVLPGLTGVELLGGPYLHTPVSTNFTQFGEGRLFGRADWDRDFFVRHARLYRPTAICCWSPRARSFCRNNPDLVRILADDGALLFGMVIGFDGPAIRGSARVRAGPNRLVVDDAVADPGGLVVLRYHHVPYLKASPPVDLEAVRLEDDPVPFIGFRPTGGPITIELALPGRR